jgi:hypothetical protein
MWKARLKTAQVERLVRPAINEGLVVTNQYFKDLTICRKLLN